MSAGPFQIYRYEADNGDIHPIKLQPETVAANIGGANSPPSGQVSNDISAWVNRGNRQYGLRPRYVTVRFTSGAPTGYKADQLYRIPILTQARFNAVGRGTTGTYLGEAVTVVSKTTESAQ
jgi:hypothetical protein